MPAAKCWTQLSPWCCPLPTRIDPSSSQFMVGELVAQVKPASASTTSRGGGNGRCGALIPQCAFRNVCSIRVSLFSVVSSCRKNSTSISRNVLCILASFLKLSCPCWNSISRRLKSECEPPISTFQFKLFSEDASPSSPCCRIVCEAKFFRKILHQSQFRRI